jgi:hypothetical protein
MMTKAVIDMQTSYLHAAGKSNPDFIEIGAGANVGKVVP